MDLNITNLLKTGFKLTAISSFFACQLALAAPQGGSVVAGSANISQQNSQTIINQSSQNTVINWSSFDTAASESVLFHQPNSSAIALNKINSGLPTNFNGSLSANGQVWIINSAGILFGNSANINVAGLVATTNNINNNNFMSGNYVFEAPSNLSASIINNGNITVADSGIVALVGPNVINNGVIQANLGTVQLSTGGAFVLDLNGDGLINFGSNSPIANGSVANNNLISATGGKVYMTANAAAGVLDNVISMSGTIEATTATTGKNGEIILNGGNSGVTHVSGTLRAPKGHIETSGHVLVLDPNVVIDASDGGSWLVDPWNITVVAGNGLVNNGGATSFTPTGTNSQIGANLIINQLNAGTGVTLDTTSGGSDAGNITISSVIAATTSSADFTLLADNNININAALSIRGAFNATATAGKINIGANVTSTGTQTYNQPVVVTANSVLTSTAGAINFVSTIDDSATRSHSLTVIATSAPTFTGAVGGTTPLKTLAITYPSLTVDATTASLVNSQLNKGTNVTLTASSGDLTLSSPITQTINAAANTLSLVSAVNFNLGSSITLIGTTLAFTAPSITIDSTFAAYIVGQLNAGTLVDLIGEGGPINVTSPIVTSSGTAELAFFNADVDVSADIITDGFQFYDINTNGNSLTVESGATVAAAGGISVDALVVTAGAADITINGTLGTTADRSAISFNISDSPVFGSSSTIIATTFGISGTRGASVTIPAGITLDITSSLTITTDTTTNVGQIIVNGTLGLLGQPIPTIQLQGGFVSGGSAVVFAPHVFIYADTLFLRYIRGGGGGIIINNVQDNWHITTFLVDTEISQASNNIFKMTSTGQLGSAVNPIPNIAIIANNTPTTSGIQINPGAQIYATNLTFNDPRTGFISLDNGSINAYHVTGVMNVISGNPNTFAPFGPLVINGVIGAPGDEVGQLGLVGTTITLNTPGTSIANPGIKTTGLQTYFDPVILAADQFLKSNTGNIDFRDTINGAFDLNTSSTSGATIFEDIVGGTTPLANISITGTTDIDTTTINTSGDQLYSNAVVLGASPTLTSSAGSITLGGTVNGAFGLTTSVPNGQTITFGGVVGGTTALTSITTSATGITDINGGQIRTSTGAQNYNNPVFIGADTVLGGAGTSGAINIHATLDSANATPRALTLTTTAMTTFFGNIGLTNILKSLTVTNASTINIAGPTPTIDVTQSFSFGGALTLATDATLNTNAAGTITFSSTISGANDLTANATSTGTVNFNSDIGSVGTPLTSLTVTGTAQINTNVAPTIFVSGTETYNNNVLLNSIAAITFGSGIGSTTVFNGTVNRTVTSTAITIAGNLVVGSSGSIGLSSVIASLFVNGTTLGPNVTTSGNQTYVGAVALNTDETMISTAGSIAYNSTVDNCTGLACTSGPGPFNLVDNAATTVTFTGAVGSLAPLNSLTVTAPTNININGGSVHTVNNQLFNSPVALGASTTFTSDSGSIAFANTVNGGFNLIANAATTLTFGGAVGGTTPLTSLTATGASGINVNGGSIHTVNNQLFNSAVLLGANATFTSNAGSIRFTNTVNGVTSARNLITSAATDTEFDNTVGNTNLINNITVTGPALINTTAITSQLLQTYNGAVTIGANANLTGTTITFGSTVDDATAGTHNLTITGNMVANNNIGTSKALNNLTVTGTSHVGGNITTAHNQLFQGAYTLTANNTLTSNSGGITFNSTVDGAFNLATIANSLSVGIVTFNGAVGGTTPLTSLSSTVPGNLGGFTDMNTTLVHTTGTQTYSGAVIIENPTPLSSPINFIGSTVSFNDALMSGSASPTNPVDITITGNFALIGPNGNVQTAGASTLINSLHVTGTSIFSNPNVSNGVNTLGSQNYDGLVTLNPGALSSFATVFFATHNSGSAITFGTNTPSVTALQSNGGSPGGAEFILSAGTALNFNGIVGGVSGSNPLSTLTILGASATTNINTTQINTTGAQSYGSPVVIGDGVAAVLTSTTSGMTFSSTVDALTTGGESLQLIAFNPVNLTGNIGSIHPLSSLTIGSNSVATEADINTSAILTTVFQKYFGKVIVGTTTNLTSGTVTFVSTVDDLTANTDSLTITGNMVADDNIGTSKALDNLTVTGTSHVGGNITTAHNQLFQGAYTLTANNILTSNSGNITFNSTVDGAFNLTTSAASGTVSFDGIVGTTPLSSLTVTGIADINTTAITTTNNQLFNNAVVLGSNSTLTSNSGNITFNSTLDGAFDLTTSAASGAVTFDGIVGTTPLSSLTVTGTADINTTAITTTNNQLFNGPAVLGSNSTLTSNSGGITFGSTLNGAFNLTTSAASGTVTFDGIVGTTPLSSLTVTGTADINTTAITTTNNQLFNNAVVLGSNSTLTSNSGNITFNSTLDGGFDLTTTAASGTVSFDGIVGTTPLNSLTVTGIADINTTAITTANNQLFNNAVVLGSNSTLTSNSGNITFGSTLDGAFDLTTTAASGAVIFDGIVGTTPLNSLTVTGTADINTTAITTTNNQLFNNAVVLGSDTTLTSTADGITFSSTVDSDSTPRALTIDAFLPTVLTGNIGNISILKSLEIINEADINTGIIKTTTSQLYDGIVKVGANAVLTTTNAGGFITFFSTLDGDGSGPWNLTVTTSTARFKNIIGGINALNKLIVNSNIINFDTNATAITTIDEQDYTGATAMTIGADPVFSASNFIINIPLVLLLDTTYISTAGDIDFQSTINGPANLFLFPAATFSAIFEGNVGAITPLASLIVTGDTTIGGANSITTNGDQNYSNNIFLNNNLITTALTTGAILFGDQNVASSGVQSPTFGLSPFDLTAVTNNSANGPTGAGITGIVRVNNFTVGGPGGANLSFNYPAAESFVLGQGAAQAIQNTQISPDFRPAAIYCVNNFCATLPGPVPSNPIPNNVPPTQEFIPPEGPGCSAAGCDNLTIIVYDIPPYNGFGFPPGTIVYPAGNAGISGVVSGICGNPPIAVDEFGVPRKLHVGSVIYKYDTVIADKYSCTCIKTNSHETICTHDTKKHPRWTSHCETCQINKLDKKHYVKSKIAHAKKYDPKNTFNVFEKHWWHYPLSDHDLFLR